MKTLNRIILCFLFATILWSHSAYSVTRSPQDSLIQQSVNTEPEIRAFDQQALEAYKDQYEFDYSSELAAGPSWFGVFLFWLLSRLAAIFGEPNAEWLMDNLFKLVIIVIVIIGVVLIVKMRYGAMIIGTGENRSSSPVVPELGQEEDYEQLFQQALKSDNLKLASRYLYIKTLQALHQKGVVKLTKWKTVLEYTEEIPSEQRPFFQKIAILFESTWYGNYEPSQHDFEEGISSSNQLVN